MLAGIITGGLLRLAPEVFKIWDRKNERKHELAMTNLSIEADKVKGQMAIAIQESQADATYDAGALQAIIESIRAQATRTGVKWVDAISALVRPAITFAYFGLYAVVRLASIVIMASSNTDAMTLVNAAWTAPDMEMLGAIMNFWFLDRILKRDRK